MRDECKGVNYQRVCKRSRQERAFGRGDCANYQCHFQMDGLQRKADARGSDKTM